MEDVSKDKRCTPLTVEQDLEDVLRLPSFAEFCQHADNSDSQSSYRSSAPDPIRTSLSQDDSSSSADTPVFGDPRSPFAASPEEIVRLCGHFRHVLRSKASPPFEAENVTEECTGSGDHAENAHYQHSVFGSPQPTSQVESGLQYDQVYYGQPPSGHPPSWSISPYPEGSQFPNMHPSSYQGLHHPIQCGPTPWPMFYPSPFPPPPYPYFPYAPAPPFQPVAICQQCGSSHWMASSTENPTMQAPNNRLLNFGSLRIRSIGRIQARANHFEVSRISRKGKAMDVQFQFLQREIPLASHEELEALLVEILPETLVISSDVFGNFVIQKLLEFGTSRVIAELVAAIKPHTVHLSLQKYSCRVIQKSIEALPYEFKADLAVQLDGYVELCSKDEYANHVVQRCIQHLKTEHIHFIYEALLLNTESLAVHPYGRRVVQKAVERSNGDFRVRGLVHGIVDRAVMFAYDPYASLVIQHLLRQGPPEIVSALLDELTPHILELSVHKYSSKVVEACLTVCNKEAKQRIRNLILSERNPDALDTLLRDFYGHFIVDRMIESCLDDEKCKIQSTAIRVRESKRQDAKQRRPFERIEGLLH